MSEVYIFASDFDKTLSLTDSGFILSEKLGISNEEFNRKIIEIREKNIVQLGGELIHLLLRDPAYQGKVSKELLIQIGKEIPLKSEVKNLFKVLEKGIGDMTFISYIISTAPLEIVTSALKDILPQHRIFGTELIYDANNIVIDVKKTQAGDAKVATLDYLSKGNKVPRDRMIYVGDGISDIHAMLHLDAYSGYPISVSLSPYMAHIAKRTVISTNALAVLVPILQDILNYSEKDVRLFFNKHNFSVQEWQRARIEWLEIISH